MDVFLAEVLKGLDIVFNVLVSLSCTDLDRVADIDRLDTGQVKACSFDLRLQGVDLFLCPELAGLLAVQCGDNAGYAGNLADLPELNRVVL